MTTGEKVFAIVVTYNGAEWIEACVSSLSLSDVQIEIIVVDNASTDATVQIVKRCAVSTVIQMPDNVGFGRANNIGIAKAINRGAQHLFLLNQDSTVLPNTIRVLLEASALHIEFGILSPLHNYSDHEMDKSFLMYVVRGAPEFFSDLLNEAVKQVYEVPFINAAAWLIKRSCIDTVGGFDPLFFMYCEDEDYCHRALRHGFKCGFVPGAAFYHFRGKSPEERSAWNRLLARARRVESSMILGIKVGERSPFIMDVYREYLTKALEAISALLKWRDVNEFLSTVIAMGRFTLALPRGYRHKRLSATRGRHWI